jgi:hypothetical protein
VGSNLIVIGRVFREDSPKVLSVEHQQMVRALAPGHIAPSDRKIIIFALERRGSMDQQVRAEIVIQPEEGRWVFTPNELSDLAEGLRSVLLKSKPEGGWPFRLTLKQYVGLFDHAIPDGHNYSE